MADGVCARLGRSVACVGLGLFAFVVSLVLEAYTEYRAVATSRTIELGRQYVVESSCTPDPALSGRLVHISCPLSGMRELGSTVLGVADLPPSERIGLRLESKCEVREWLESSRTEVVDGKKRREFFYTRDWSTKYVDSRKFADPKACKASNRGSACVNTAPADQKWWSNDMNVDIDSAGNAATSSFYVVESVPTVNAGGFLLPADMRAEIGTAETLHPVLTCAKGSAHCPPGALVEGKYLTFKDLIGPAASPTPMRRQFLLFNATHASVLAQQVGHTFQQWTSPKLASSFPGFRSLYSVKEGAWSAAEMLDAVEGENRAVTWSLRGISFFAAFVSVNMMLAPVEALMSLVPWAGECLANLASCALTLLSFFVAASFWLLVCSVSWITYRPHLGVPLAVLAVTSACLSCTWKRRMSQQDVADGSSVHWARNGGEDGGVGAGGENDLEASAPLLSDSEAYAFDDECGVHSRPPAVNPESGPGAFQPLSHMTDAVMQDKECVVCMVATKTQLLRPCGHVCVCLACSAQLSNCPICRSQVVESIRAFI